MERKKVHIVSHSHWDREWYRPFEKHRMQMVKLFDDLFELFETDPDFKSFFLDGQTVLMEDYLEIRPENRDKLKKYIREGRLSCGPWYILQDEFLVSGESSVRNLLAGKKDAQEFSPISKIGYFPDAFGNAGQMPQLLKQAGIDVIFFGRGVKPIGFNNQVDESGEYESVFSEMSWQSPDSTSVLGVLFANWYCNGMEVPTDEEQARSYWEDRIPKADKFASTENLLFLNGCDHQPVQKNLSKAIKTAQKLFPEVEFVHSNYQDFVKDVLSSQKSELSTIRGELTSQETDGWMTLVNTCSAHIPLKQMNQKNQIALEKLAEPLSAFSSLLGKEYPAHWLSYAWKTLMKNHPHDSICGCSVDEVNREIHTRFEKSLAVSEELNLSASGYLAEQVDTTAFSSFEGAVPFVVMNTTGWKRTGKVVALVDVFKEYATAEITAAHGRMAERSVEGFTLIDQKGNTIDCEIEDLGVHFGYDLPEDKFRQPYMARTLRVCFEAKDFLPFGAEAFALYQTKTAPSKGSLVTGQNQMENDYLRVQIHADGTIDLTLKETGKVYQGLCEYEETGDIGNEYIYFRPVSSEAITTKGCRAEIKLIKDTSFEAAYQITHTLQIPESADETLLPEQESMIEFNHRKAQRSKKLVDFKIKTVFSITKNGRGVEIQSSFDNTAKDHRLRMLFRTGLETDTHIAESIFEAIQRQNRPAACWENPSNCQHQQCFVSMDDKVNGITIANFGLNEYEVLPDDGNAIAVTLLRSVGEMGDWGVFPTPEAQCPGRGETKLLLIPHAKSLLESGAFVEAYQFQVDMPAVQTGIHSGKISSPHSFLQFEGKTLALSGLKLNEETGDMIVRWFNLSDKACELVVRPNFPVKKCYMSNVVEDELEEIKEAASQEYRLSVGPAQIITIGIQI